MESELIIRSSIVHLCDEELQEPVIGQSLQIDELALGYFTKHTKKILGDTNLRLGRAKGENLVLKKYMEERDLIAFSTFYAKKAHKLYADNGIRGGDLVFFDGTVDGAEIVGMIKLDYKKGYIHQIGYEEGGIATRIHLHQSILPNPSQKISDGIVFYLEAGIASLISSSAMISGEKDTVIDKIFDLEMEASLSEKVQTIEDAVSEVIAYYYDEDIRKNNEVEKCISEIIEESGAMDVDQIVERGFRDKPEAQKAFKEKMENSGIQKNVVVNKKVERKYARKRVIVADNGIEIHVPMERVNQEEFIEFQTTEDGMIQIVLKNIEKLEGK
jgi:hypothetical protein